MAKTCIGNTDSNRKTISELSDEKILYGLERHADPAWWKEVHIVKENTAYLRRWGSLLRREARKRGLL